MTTLYLDTTGSITRKVGNTESFNYALVADGMEFKAKSFPVVHMLSERHDVPTITHVLIQACSEFRRAVGGTAELHPPRFITDCS